MRMLAAEKSAIRIVVKIDQVLTPPDKHGVTRGEDDLHGSSEISGPLRDWPQRSLGPIEGLNQRAHFAGAIQHKTGKGLAVGGWFDAGFRVSAGMRISHAGNAHVAVSALGPL